MDERAEAGRPVPEWRGAVPRDDRPEIGVPLGELGDSALEARLVESDDQTTVPCSVNPAAGSGSKALLAAPRSQARAFSPSDGR